jgi:hypothetical protein
MALVGRRVCIEAVLPTVAAKADLDRGAFLPAPAVPASKPVSRQKTAASNAA